VPQGRGSNCPRLKNARRRPALLVIDLEVRRSERKPQSLSDGRAERSAITRGGYLLRHLVILVMIALREVMITSTFPPDLLKVRV
jgi:hypothetical protein